MYLGKGTASFLRYTIIFLILTTPAITFSETGTTPPATVRAVRDIMVEQFSRGRTVCSVVEDMIKAGYNTTEIVETAILMGHPACLVVKCALEAGGKLEDVVTAAFRVGASADVIVTCSIAGGAESTALARIIERFCLSGMGFTPFSTDQTYLPTITPTIGGGGGVSASPFRP